MVASGEATSHTANVLRPVVFVLRSLLGDKMFSGYMLSAGWHMVSGRVIGFGKILARKRQKRGENSL